MNSANGLFYDRMNANLFEDEYTIWNEKKIDLKKLTRIFTSFLE